MGEGLQFASVVALTVSFGLGLTATIHFLNRLRLESKPGADPAIAVEQATILVGPALILTSVVLACGLAVMVFSDLPSLRLFGWLSAFAMLAALVADLLILRPTAMYVNQLARRFKKALRRRRSGVSVRRLRHRDRDVGDFAAGRADRHAQRIAAGADRQRCAEAHGVGSRLDVAAVDLAGQRADHAARGLVPRAGNVAAVGGDVACQLELVAVAGAAQAQGSALPLAVLVLRQRMRSLDPSCTVILPLPDQFPAKCASGPSAACAVWCGEGEKACGDSECGNIACVHGSPKHVALKPADAAPRPRFP